MSKSMKSIKLYPDNYLTTDKEKELLHEFEKEATIQSLNTLEPTINEMKKVIKIINNFIKRKKRIIYGGTALNELLKAKNPDDAIYDEYDFSDVEFYSYEPVVDLYELCTELYEKGFKYVDGQEAQHEETFSIFVNFRLYCDITYAPKNIFNNIKTIEINGFNYVDPHFMYIDYLRMENDPMGSAWRWSKASKRKVLLLKNYPIELYYGNFNNTDNLYLSNEGIELITKLKKQFILNKDTLVYIGLYAYNYYVNFSKKRLDLENKKIKDPMMARINKNFNIDNYVIGQTFMDLVSVDYNNDVIGIHNYLLEITDSPTKLMVFEYFPMFQFMGHTTEIYYNDELIVRIMDANNMCIPYHKLDSGNKIAPFQYLLMNLLMNKFRYHIRRNKNMYFNYGLAISNLCLIRDHYFETTGKGPLNKGLYCDYIIDCIGCTMSFGRSARLRRKENEEKGKYPIRLNFDKMSEEARLNFDPKKALFKNTSGNMVLKNKNRTFCTEASGKLALCQNSSSDEQDISEDTEE